MDYTKAEALRMTARVHADYGSRLWDFLLTLEGDTVTIREPDTLAGVQARVGEDGVTLLYAGAEVYTGAVTASGLSPVEALPLMGKLWREGLVTSAQSTPEGLALLFRVEDGAELETVFDPETFAPRTAALYWEGVRVLWAEFTDISF